MAAIPHFGASNTTTVTSNTNASWTDIVTYTFAAADQVAGATYAVFWQGAFFSGLATSDYRVRVTQGGTARASINVEVKEVDSPLDQDQQGGFFFFTAAGTPADATFALQLQSESTNTSSAYNGYLRIIKLPPNSVWVESTAEQTTTSNTTFTDKTGASISVSGEYLFLASAEARTNTNNSFSVETAITVDDVPANSIITGSSDTSNYVAQVVAHKGSATSTAKVQFRQTASVAATLFIRNVRLLALKVSDFRNIFHVALGSDSAGTGTTYTNALTTTQTVSSGDHFVLAAFNVHPGATSTISGYARLTSGGTQIDEAIRESTSTTSPLGTPSHTIQRLETYSAGSRTWTLDRKSESTNATRLLAGASISVIDLDDGVGGGGGTAITPQAATQAQTSTSPTVAAKSSVTGNNATQSQTSTSPTVSLPGVGVTPDNAAQSQTSTSPTVAAKSTLAPVDAAQSHTATSPTVAAKSTLAPVDAAQSHTATSPALTASGAVSPFSATHTHASTSPTIATKSVITPVVAAQAQVATQPSLSASGSVVVESASQSHTANSPVVGFNSVIVAVNNASHGQSVTSPLLSAKSVIVVHDCFTAQVSTSPTIDALFSVHPTDANQSHEATVATVTSSSVVFVDDAGHEHVATQPVRLNFDLITDELWAPAPQPVWRPSSSNSPWRPDEAAQAPWRPASTTLVWRTDQTNDKWAD